MDFCISEIPLDHKLQKDRLQLVNKGSLSKRRKPSRYAHRTQPYGVNSSQQELNGAHLGIITSCEQLDTRRPINNAEERVRGTNESREDTKKSLEARKSTVLIQTWERRSQLDSKKIQPLKTNGCVGQRVPQHSAANGNRANWKPVVSCKMPDAFSAADKANIKSKYVRCSGAWNMAEVGKENVVRSNRLIRPKSLGTIHGSSSEEPEWISLSRKLCAKFVQSHLDAEQAAKSANTGSPAPQPPPPPTNRTNNNNNNNKQQQEQKAKIEAAKKKKGASVAAAGETPVDPPWIDLSRKLCNKFIEEHIECGPNSVESNLPLVKTASSSGPKSEVRIVEKLGRKSAADQPRRPKDEPEWVTLSRRLRAKFIEGHRDDPDTISLDNQLNASDLEEYCSETKHSRGNVDSERAGRRVHSEQNSSKTYANGYQDVTENVRTNGNALKSNSSTISFCYWSDITPREQEINKEPSKIHNAAHGPTQPANNNVHKNTTAEKEFVKCSSKRSVPEFALNSNGYKAKEMNFESNQEKFQSFHGNGPIFQDSEHFESEKRYKPLLNDDDVNYELTFETFETEECEELDNRPQSCMSDSSELGKLNNRTQSKSLCDLSYCEPDSLECSFEPKMPEDASIKLRNAISVVDLPLYLANGGERTDRDEVHTSYASASSDRCRNSEWAVSERDTKHKQQTEINGIQEDCSYAITKRSDDSITESTDHQGDTISDSNCSNGHTSTSKNNASAARDTIPSCSEAASQTCDSAFDNKVTNHVTSCSTVSCCEYENFIETTKRTGDDPSACQIRFNCNGDTYNNRALSEDYLPDDAKSKGFNDHDSKKCRIEVRSASDDRSRPEIDHRDVSSERTSSERTKENSSSPRKRKESKSKDAFKQHEDVFDLVSRDIPKQQKTLLSTEKSSKRNSTVQYACSPNDNICSVELTETNPNNNKSNFIDDCINGKRNSPREFDGADSSYQSINPPFGFDAFDITPLSAPAKALFLQNQDRQAEHAGRKRLESSDSETPNSTPFDAGTLLSPSSCASDSETSSWTLTKNNSCERHQNSLHDTDFSDCSLSVKCNDTPSCSNESTMEKRVDSRFKVVEMPRNNDRISTERFSEVFVDCETTKDWKKSRSLDNLEEGFNVNTRTSFKGESTEKRRGSTQANYDSDITAAMPDSLKHLFNLPLSPIYTPSAKTSLLLSKTAEAPPVHYYSSTSQSTRNSIPTSKPKTDRSSSIKIKDIAHGIILTFRKFHSHSKSSQLSSSQYVDVSHLAEVNGASKDFLPERPQPRPNGQDVQNLSSSEYGKIHTKRPLSAGYFGHRSTSESNLFTPTTSQPCKCKDLHSNVPKKPHKEDRPKSFNFGMLAEAKRNKSQKKTPEMKEKKNHKGKCRSKKTEAKSVSSVSRKVQQMADGTLCLVTTVSGDSAVPGVYSDSQDTASETSVHAPVKPAGESSC